MKNTTLVLAMIAAAAVAGNAEAIYKCKTPNGVVYQDRPCKEGAESDVSIVKNSIELARPGSAQDDSTQSNTGRQDGQSSAQKQARSGDDYASAARGADNRTNGPSATGADSASKRNPRVVESVLPMTADEARRTEPTAKYYTTDAAAPGAEAPESMTCESPNGEKRRFILSNGKLTSI